LDSVAEEDASQRLGNVFGAIFGRAEVELLGIVVEGEGGADLGVLVVLGRCEVIDGERNEVALFVVGWGYACGGWSVEVVSQLVCWS
jgi:hypothetical protein